VARCLTLANERFRVDEGVCLCLSLSAVTYWSRPVADLACPALAVHDFFKAFKRPSLLPQVLLTTSQKPGDTPSASSIQNDARSSSYVDGDRFKQQDAKPFSRKAVTPIARLGRRLDDQNDARSGKHANRAPANQQDVSTSRRKAGTSTERLDDRSTKHRRYRRHKV
jgi:hypothetical protein